MTNFFRIVAKFETKVMILIIFFYN